MALDPELEYAVISRTIGHIKPLAVHEGVPVDLASDPKFVAVEREASRQACPKVSNARIGLAKQRMLFVTLLRIDCPFLIVSSTQILPAPQRQPASEDSNEEIGSPIL